VAEAYQTKLGYAFEPADKEKLRQLQRVWIATRNASCTGATPGHCLAKLYLDRLAILKQP